MKIKVEISGRHLHLSRKDLDVLFGKNYELTKLRDLSQKGEFAAMETVKVVGNKGVIHKVRIVGPTRPKTQIELTQTECYQLGIEAPIALSGDLKKAAAIEIVGPVGSVKRRAAIVAKRHLHINEKDAKKLKVKNGQEISLRLGKQRAVTFHHIEVRIKENFRTAVHIDTDEANAADVSGQVSGEIVK